jgi:hypothetical protein
MLGMHTKYYLAMFLAEIFKISRQKEQKEKQWSDLQRPVNFSKNFCQADA